MSKDESPTGPERGAAAPEAERQDARDRESEAPPDLTVVGIGASAGGLTALKELLGRVPADSGLAWVVVVHLSPEHESHLSDLLQPDLAIPVEQVTTTLPLEPDRVYVIPPNANLEAVDTHLRLSELEERREKRAPVDHFFRTLARTYDGRAIGVVLTGTGSDGALGMKEIKEKGGLTVVQRPEEAEYPGMPRNALATGLVDLELPLARIPGAAVRYVATRPRVRIPRGDDDLDGDGRRILQKIFAQVQARTDHDFSAYKHSTVMRRISRRMQIHEVEGLEDYLELFRSEPEEASALVADLLITVTRFFRDPEVFQALKEKVIPELFHERDRDDDVRVWSVGCATGEEAYSLAILLLEEAGRHHPPPRIQVFASDLHEEALEKAREGFYTGDIEADVSPERLHRFFEKEAGGYRVRREVREVVVFSPHNLLGDPPFSRLDLVLCRNLLIYLKRGVQDEVAALFHYALGQDGVLVLGPSETLGPTDLFRGEDKERGIFRRRNVPGPEPGLPVFPHARTGLPQPSLETEPESGPATHGALHQRMVERFAPPSVLVNSRDKIVHLSQRAGRYLVHPGGEPTTRVSKLVREELRIELRAALHEARERGAPRRTRPVSVPFEGEDRSVTMDVRPSPEPGEEGYALVIFDERPVASKEAPAGAGEEREAGEQTTEAGDGVKEVGGPSTEARIRELEAERDLARQRLGKVIDDYEVSQEEMKVSNEELQSANEELRSTMEELETSKEELQSMNEELQTVNQENRQKMEELAQLSSDLQNFLTATEIATLFLDRHLQVLRFTPNVAEIFNLRMEDRGRPLSDITSRLEYGRLVEDAREVLDDLGTVEREVVDEEGRWYLTRMRPYRSTEDRIEGVVVTFVDITDRRRAEEAVRESEEKFRALAADLEVERARLDAIITSFPVGVFIVDADGAMVLVNENARTIWGGKVPMAGGVEEYESYRAWWADTGERIAARNMPLARALRGETLRNRAVEFERFDGTRGTQLVSAAPIETPDGSVTGSVAAVQDITEMKRTEEALREREEQLRKLASTLIRAEEAERHRVSRLLHDDLQQLLYGIQMKLAVGREEGGRGRQEALGTHIAQALTLLEEAITRTRQLTVDLSPPVLDKEGLGQALQWLRTQMRDLHGLDVEVRGELSGKADSPEAQLLLFHAVRELLFNVAKHAGTERVVVELEEEREGELIRVTVKDEGRGFDPGILEEEGADRKGTGLFRVRERIHLQGGQVRVLSRPGEGTRVVIRIPSSAAGE